MLEKLREYGCDIDGVMERFLEDEEFYWECYDIFIAGDELEQLGQALQQKNTKEAFICSHGMKGTAANLGLTSIFEKLERIVEPLRADTMEGAEREYEALCNEWKKYRILRQN